MTWAICGNCGRPARSKGSKFCHRCYGRQRRTGDPNGLKPHQGMTGRGPTAETRAKMSASAKQRLPPPHLGQKPFLGKTHAPEAREKIAAARTGTYYGEVGDRHPNWRGDDVGYSSLHGWIYRHYGQPNRCDRCKTTDSEKHYEWANISGEYRRDRDDFLRLCKSCHTKFDKGGRSKIEFSTDGQRKL